MTLLMSESATGLANQRMSALRQDPSATLVDLDGPLAS